MRAASILLSGWRFLPHSYSLVCQSYCLELLRRPEFRVYFEDLPYFSPNWRPMARIYGEEADAALRALTPPPPGERPDAELRFGYPMDLLRAPRAGRTTIFTTIEVMKPTPYHLPEGLPADEAQRRHDYLILTCSNWSKEGLLRSGVREDRVAVLPLGFDPAVFQPPVPEQRAQCRAELGLAPEDFVFLHAGAMTPNKGVRFLIAAFAQVLESHPRALLLLKGMDALYTSREFFQEELDSLGPGAAEAVLGRIRYVGGALPFDAMARLYHAADCYVSSYLAEAFNIPVLEAAACGLPVICTGGGSTDDFVNDDFAMRIESVRHPLAVDGVPGAIGLLPDQDHLAHLMLCAIDDAEFREQARRAGPAYVNARFTWARVVDRLAPLLLEGRAP